VGERPSRTLLGYDWDSTIPGQFRLYLHWRTAQGYQTEVRDLTAAENIFLPPLQGSWGLSGRWTIPPPRPDDHYVPLGLGIVWTGQSLSALASPLAPGTMHNFSQRFVSGRPVWRDLVVSVRLVGLADDGFTWTWCDLVDSVPAMGGIPTLKWIGGSAVLARRTIIYPEEPVPFLAYCTSQKPAPHAPILHVAPEATPGETVSASLTLYSAFTNEIVPILDERITARYAWLPLGQSTLAAEE